MSYAAKELGQQDGAPVMLFEFTRGTTIWYFANYPVDFTSSGHTYVHESISMGRIQQSGVVSKDALTIKLPIANSFAQTFLGYPPDKVTRVNVIRTHYDDTDRLVVWKGRITGVSSSVGTMSLTCDNIFSALDVTAPEMASADTSTKHPGPPKMWRHVR